MKNGTVEVKCIKCGIVLLTGKVETTCTIMAVCNYCDEAITEGIPKINKVVVHKNCMVLVFDAHGRQIPHYQGEWKEQMITIYNNKPSEVEVEFLDE